MFRLIFINQYILIRWWASIPWPPPYQGGVLPAELHRLINTLLERFDLSNHPLMLCGFFSFHTFFHSWSPLWFSWPVYLFCWSYLPSKENRCHKGWSQPQSNMVSFFPLSLLFLDLQTGFEPVTSQRYVGRSSAWATRDDYIQFSRQRLPFAVGHKPQICCRRFLVSQLLCVLDGNRTRSVPHLLGESTHHLYY